MTLAIDLDTVEPQPRPGELAAPATVLGLDYPDHLLVWSIRHLATGRQDAGPRIARELAGAAHSPCQVVRARHAWTTVIQILGRHGRRPLSVGLPSFMPLTADEQRLVMLRRAAGVSDWHLAGMHAIWLVRGRAADALIDALGELSRVVE